jgi:hypothetical protein
MMAGKKKLVKFSNQIYDFELKYLKIYYSPVKNSLLIYKDILFMNKMI